MSASVNMSEHLLSGAGSVTDPVSDMLRGERNAFVESRRIERPDEPRHRDLPGKPGEMSELLGPIDAPGAGEQMGRLMVVLQPQQALGPGQRRERCGGSLLEEDELAEPQGDAEV